MINKFSCFIFLIFSLFLFGCSNNLSDIPAPPNDISLEEVSKINLKTLDLNKLSKTDITEIDGIKLCKDAMGYELEYRYPNQPIKIKIVKFEKKEQLTNFWKQWLKENESCGSSKSNSIKFMVEQNDYKYAVYAWIKGQWFTYIGIPSQSSHSEPLREKVKEIIADHYLNLAKRDFK